MTIKLKLFGQRQKYTVQAMDKRYIVASKPFNARKTYLYTIIDLEEKICGPDSMLFGPMYANNTIFGASKTIRALNCGDLAISHRKSISIKPEDLKYILETVKI